MYPDETVVIEPEAIEDVTPEVAPEVPEESIEDVRAKLVKSEEIANNQRIRAEKAEKSAKETPSPSTLSSSDLIAVTNAKLHEDDFERVERFAKSENLTLRDALKHPELKAILDLREEQRKTAQATNVSTTRRSSNVTTDDVLLSNASKGDIPDNDSEIERLIAAKSRRN